MKKVTEGVTNSVGVSDDCLSRGDHLQGNVTQTPVSSRV